MSDINNQNTTQNSSLIPLDKKRSSLEVYSKGAHISKGIQFIVDQILHNSLQDIKNEILSECIRICWNEHKELFYIYLQEGRGVKSALIRTIANDDDLNRTIFGGKGADKFLLKKNLIIFCQRLAKIFGLDKNNSVENILIILGLNRNDIMLAKLSVIKQASVYLTTYVSGEWGIDRPRTSHNVTYVKCYLGFKCNYIKRYHVGQI